MNKQDHPQLGTTVKIHDGVLTIVHSVPFDGTPCGTPKALKGDRTFYPIAEYGNAFAGNEVKIEGIDLNSKAPEGREIIAKLKLSLGFFNQALSAKPCENIKFL